MFDKVISILQKEMRSRDKIVGDATGVITDYTKKEQAGIVAEMVLAVAVLQSAESPAMPSNTASLKLPTLEECYKGIPAPEDAREAAMFFAGVGECHKFISRQLQA